MGYRNLTKLEIEELEKNNCCADNWGNISVKQYFSPKNFFNVKFRGEVKLGEFKDAISDINGIKKETGIFNSTIIDSVIGDNCFINDVKTIKNYNIQERVYIENVGNLIADPDSKFGEGVEVEVLNEGGGREIPLYKNLSSQLAYILANYKHDEILQKQFERFVDNEIPNSTGVKGTICSETFICNTLTIKNINILGKSFIANANTLDNGTIFCDENDSVNIGANVILENFIVRGSSKINNSAILNNCFVGEGVKIGEQYSATNTLFFANSEAFHGEACSVFAGPYTVTHHKSSLLIAGLYSFYNAGSGTNQSNHMYKLGPIHQGIIERGSKTGSFSYMLWPSRVGPFSVVIGKHYSNFDASDFPFSYISEEEGKTVLTPAMNIFTVGTNRDVKKWASRDRRKSKNPLDRLSFDLYSPYIVSKVIKASNTLNRLYKETPREKEIVVHKGLNIPRLVMRTCKKYYDLAIHISIGDILVKQIKNNNITSLNALLPYFKQNFYKDFLNEKWIDLCGMITKKSELDRIFEDIKNEKINSLQEFDLELDQLHQKYESLTWDWYTDLIYEKYEVDKNSISNEVIIQILNNWKDNKLKLLKMTLKDAEKEFDASSKIGYGIDSDEETVISDFKNVRGEYSNNKFVRGIEEEMEEIGSIYSDLVAFFN